MICKHVVVQYHSYYLISLQIPVRYRRFVASLGIVLFFYAVLLVDRIVDEGLQLGR